MRILLIISLGGSRITAGEDMDEAQWSRRVKLEWKLHAQGFAGIQELVTKKAHTVQSLSRCVWSGHLRVRGGINKCIRSTAIQTRRGVYVHKS